MDFNVGKIGGFPKSITSSGGLGTREHGTTTSPRSEPQEKGLLPILNNINCELTPKYSGGHLGNNIDYKA